MIEVNKKQDCCGCTACAAICPKDAIIMKEDNEGFLYPEVDRNVCVNCRLCEQVCPIKNYRSKSSNPKQKAAIVQNKDQNICRQSTSGGAFTPIAEYVIDRGGIVFGVAIDDTYRVKHIGVTNKEDLEKFRNSKYVQSDMGDTYKRVKYNLEKGTLVCFSGTPCQIEGLLGYLSKSYDNLILVDVVCRAVPSPGVWRKYIDMETSSRGECTVRFRDKALGYQYSTMEIKDENGLVTRGGIESQPWLRMFFSGMIIRPSCTVCHFRNRYRSSDFTIWDCFNISRIDRKFNEDVGTTRVLIHSKKGEKIFEEIRDKFKCKMISCEKAIEGVREMEISPDMNEKHAEFFYDYSQLSMEELLEKYFPTTVKVKVKKNIRLILNRLGLDKTVKHIMKKG